MNLDVLLEPIPQRKRTQLCKVGAIVLGLEPKYKLALMNLLETAYVDGGLSDEDLSARLNKAGYSVGATLVYRHRRNKCVCVVVG